MWKSAQLRVKKKHIPRASLRHPDELRLLSLVFPVLRNNTFFFSLGHWLLGTDNNELHLMQTVWLYKSGCIRLFYTPDSSLASLFCHLPESPSWKSRSTASRFVLS